MHQVLWWCDVDDSWSPFLWPIIRQVARTVAPDVRNMNDFMDIRRFELDLVVYHFNYFVLS